MPLVLPGKKKAAGAFNPETDITWHALWWAEGTNFIAHGYSDLDNVTAWDDEANGWTADRVNVSYSPYYDDVDTAYNNQPTVHFNGGGTLECQTGDGWTDATYPITIVIIGALITAQAYSTFIDGESSGNRNFVGKWNSTKWNMGNFTSISSSSNNDSSPHFFNAYFTATAGNEILEVDGSGEINANSGYDTLDGVTIGGYNSSPTAWNCNSIALLGIYEGDFTADGSYSDFTTWAEDHYGLTIA